MRNQTEKTNIWLTVVEAVLAAVLALVLVLSFLHVRDDAARTGKKSLEDSVRRSVMACYAAEGVYPPDLEYVQQHYGLQINENYTVHYSIFAKNLYPEIDVTEN